MTDKEILQISKDTLTNILKTGSCWGFVCTYCPLFVHEYGKTERTCSAIMGNQASKISATKEKAIEKFLELYGKEELMEVLL